MTNRIHILDEGRGLCVVLMVAYHALYTLAAYFASETALSLFNLFYPLEPVFAGIFIALCGFSCRLSRNNLRRGVWLGAVACAMTLILRLCMPEAIILFGVLHCLAVCILLFAAARPLLDRVPPAAGLLISLALFALTWSVPTMQGGTLLGLALPEALLDCDPLFPLGFGRLYSADYFPLLPWCFCFLAGSFAGQWRDRLPDGWYRLHCLPLSWIGRHSLAIYLLHQPLIFGIAMLLSI